jgi:cation-transporting P-type ATPase C
MPGRVRVKIPSLKRSMRSAGDVKDRLEKLKKLAKFEVRPLTGSVILLFDPVRLQARDLVEQVRDILAHGEEGPCGHPGGCPAPEASGSEAVSARRGPESRHLLGAKIHAAALTGGMGFVLARRFLFRLPVSQQPLSFTGVLASAGAVPLVFRAWKDLRGGKPAGLFPFLTAACGLAIALGEALTALEIVWVLAIGMLLEEYVAERARRGIRDILQVGGENAFVLIEGKEIERPASDLCVGDRIVVRAGRKIPADGAVLEGEALVDESTITGRSEPEIRCPNDWVYAGTRVEEGSLILRADKIGEQTYLSRMVHRVEESLERPAEIEKRADVLAVRLMRLGTVATVATFLLTRNLTRCFSVMLVMACPCATVLAASTAVAAAIANGARRRILIKGGSYLEAVQGVDCVCFDKTGTITSGTPRVVEVIPRSARQDPARILAMAAVAESKSEHPLARALVDEARNRGASFAQDPVCETFLGRGVRARLGKDIVLVGNEAFVSAEGVDSGYFKRKARERMEAGRTVLYVARNGKMQGIVTLTDKVRPGAAGVLEWLRADGVKQFLLLSGDAEPIVRAIHEELGFDDYRAGLLPEDKARTIAGLVAEGRRVLMVGDGVNDTLALAEATLGVAMGAGGSEAAIESADIALAASDLEDLVVLRLLSRKALRTIEQNFWLASATNIVGILLGATGWLPPVLAGTLHVGHTLGIMLNSSRLVGWKPAGLLLRSGEPDSDSVRPPSEDP